MKIKTDFVTNSSSTCFVIIAENEFLLPNFIAAVGVNDNSVFLDIYQRLFELFKHNLIPAREFVSLDKWHQDGEAFEHYITEVFSEDTLNRILTAEREGYEVYMGRLASDNDEIEGFFCTDSFIIESEGLYIDATNDGW